MVLVFMGALAQLEELAGVAGEDSLPLRRTDFEGVNGRDRLGDQPSALLRIERGIGGEQAMRRAEESMAAAGRRRISVERRVGIEHPIIMAGGMLERCCARVAIRSAEENLTKSKTDPPGEERN